MIRGGSSRRAVMHDVAERAGVSHQTVSRVINGNPNVRPETRKRVERAMAELDYRPNALARGLARRRSRTIGVIGFDTRLWGPSSTLIAIQRAAQESGYGTLVATLTDVDRDSIQDSVRFLTDQAVDGVIVIAPTDAAATALGHLPSGLPAVALEAEYSDRVATVAVDQREGARSVTEHLIALGHQSVHHIAGPAGWREAQLRIDGWRQALDDAGLPAAEPRRGDWTAASGHACALQLLGDPGVTAVFVANDQMALGVLHAAAASGIDVPGRVSVAGFDDMPGTAFYSPALTTVHQDFDAVGRAGLVQLMHQLEGTGHGEDTLVSPRLVIRDSTAPPFA